MQKLWSLHLQMPLQPIRCALPNLILVQFPQTLFQVGYQYNRLQMLQRSQTVLRSVNELEVWQLADAATTETVSNGVIAPYRDPEQTWDAFRKTCGKRGNYLIATTITRPTRMMVPVKTPNSPVWVHCVVFCDPSQWLSPVLTPVFRSIAFGQSICRFHAMERTEDRGLTCPTCS